jgi:Uma2 family endonuclease
MTGLQTQILTEQWVQSTWEEYLEVINLPAFAEARGYYHDGRMRIEMTPVGPDHAADNTVTSFAVNLFGAIKSTPIQGFTNCSFRKTGIRECQPDLAYYLGKNVGSIPRNSSFIDLNQYPSPDLVIEISKSSLKDDLKEKKDLYQALGVLEYWILDVQNAKVIAFALSDRNCQSIDQSKVLPGLTFTLLEEAVRRSYQGNQSQVGAWLIDQIQTMN